VPRLPSLIVALSAAAFSSQPLIAQSIAKPSVVVMGFESGTVTAQIQDRRGFMAVLAGMNGGEREKYDPSQLGVGIADMLVEKLLETREFRLMERKESGTATAQYAISGSVTKFGFEETNVGGAFATVATMGLLAYKQHKTEVALTARVINLATGEIVASFSSEGVSNKGGGLKVAGIGSGGGGVGDFSKSNFRATAIGQATGRAVNNLAEKIIQQKSSF
jgi:curli biogenesis system outer membrane secretion channel CsgG